MTLPCRNPIIAQAPQEYDHEWLNGAFDAILLTLRELNDAKKVTASRVKITDLPTSAVGLETGELWNDSGTVKVA